MTEVIYKKEIYVNEWNEESSSDIPSEECPSILQDMWRTMSLKITKI